MMVDYLSSQLDWAGYQVSTKWGSGPPEDCAQPSSLSALVDAIQSTMVIIYTTRKTIPYCFSII